MLRKIILIRNRVHIFWSVAEYFTQNRLLLEQLGIIYPQVFLGSMAANAFGHCDITYLTETPQYHSFFTERFASLKRDILRFNPTAHTLVFNYIPHSKHGLELFIEACRTNFPTASIHACWTFLPQEIVLDAGFSISCWTNFSRTKQKHLELLYQRVPGDETLLPTLISLCGRDNIHTETLDGSDSSAPSALRMVGSVLDSTFSTKYDLGYRDFISAYSAPFPREAAYFASILSTLLPTTPSGCIFRWSSQVANFSPAKGYTSPFHNAYSPEEHAQVASHYKESNAATARLLGLPRLFPACEAKPDWIPWTGMTPDIACHVAKRLDCAFVQELLSSLSATPATAHMREQRIACQALLEVSAASRFCPPPRKINHPPAKVAVLTLSYNHADYIEDCIKSVIEQKTKFPVEHIIADDASSDATQTIIAKYAEKYPHITPIFRREHSSGYFNIQALFDFARNPYVALCEGDDYFTDPFKLQTQADFLDAHPDCSLCFHPVQVLFEGKPEQSRIYPPEEILPGGKRGFYDLKDLCRGNFIQTNSVMYRWRFTNGMPSWFHYHLLPGDWYWHLLHAETGKIGYIDKIMSVYRRHPQALFYTAETNTQFHRYKMCLAELETCSALDHHFKGHFKEIFNDLALGVIIDVIQFCESVGDMSRVEDIAVKYPEYMQYALKKLVI